MDRGDLGKWIVTIPENTQELGICKLSAGGYEYIGEFSLFNGILYGIDVILFISMSPRVSGKHIDLWKIWKNWDSVGMVGDDIIKVYVSVVKKIKKELTTKKGGEV
jgi:hypothetical protein